MKQEMIKVINHYNWLEKNYEQFCKNSGHKYFPGEIVAHGDKLSDLKWYCEGNNLPFYKISAIGLVVFIYHKDMYLGKNNFIETVLKLYNKHPEWYEGCGDIEDATKIYKIYDQFLLTTVK